MTDYLLDTDHLSYVQERHPEVVRRLAGLPSDARVLTSVVNVGELLRGVYLLPRSRRQRELLALYHQVVLAMEEVLPLTADVVEHFAWIDARLRRAGTPIPVNDVWVAALARFKGFVLVTNDEHFRRVDDLVLENGTR